MAEVARALTIFALAGLLEIGGGWLVWQWMRNDATVVFVVVGTAVVAGYGFVPPLQSFPDFGRVFAA